MSLRDVVRALNSISGKSKKQAKIKNARNTAVGIGIGAVLGAVAGLLFAPKKGSETRADIADGARKVADNAKKADDGAKKTAENVALKTSESCGSFLGKLKARCSKQSAKDVVGVENEPVKEALNEPEKAELDEPKQVEVVTETVEENEADSKKKK